MQFAVPQFTEVEDKLIGPLTLKQFLMLLGVAGILFFFWSIFGIGPIFYILAFPIAGAGAYVTFKNFNGRPFFYYLIPLISYIVSPKAMIFMREQEVTSFTAPSKVLKVAPGQAVPPDLESAESRLKKLAYLLDNKLEQENDIIRDSSLSATPAAPIARPAAVPKDNPLNPLIKHVADTIEQRAPLSSFSRPTALGEAINTKPPGPFNPSSILPTNLDKK